MPAQRVVLAEYFTTEDFTLLFIVRADFEEPQVVEIKTPLDEIRQFVTANFGVTEGGSRVRDLDLDEWQARFGPFVEPILPWTDEGDIVWLVPHDVLHYLPLHALKVDGCYLIERNPVCYTPSASVMKYCHAKRKGRRNRVLILADSRADRPLLHAREQALAIQQLFDPHAEVYLSGAATKTTVRQRLAEAKEDIDVLHFACHGYFDPYQSLRSGIMLASEDGDAAESEETQESKSRAESPWNLTAEEIFGLEMRADLVTLSACESGVNERRPGDELIGLTRALIYAGTPSVVVSLWSVDEISTSILMCKFYQALKDGINKAEALRKAQLGLMGMTIRDVITYCEEAKDRLTGPEASLAQQLLGWDIADLRFAARDFEAALEGYGRLRAGLEPSGEEYRSLSVAMSRCRRAMHSPGPVDYETAVYTRPYHWAPFALVGDWK
jgi:CHAT domain-containing protein